MANERRPGNFPIIFEPNSKRMAAELVAVMRREVVMKLIRSNCICALTLLLAALPVHAGGTRSSATIHKSHHGGARGITAYHRSPGNLPNGVSIFNQRNNVAQMPASTPAKRIHMSRPRYDGTTGPRYGREPSRTGGVKNASERRHPEHRPNDKHSRPGPSDPVYASSVVIAAPAGAYTAAVESGEDKCRFLTERGYDRSGRRVLVEWTVCFDNEGTAYVPDEGRRILAHF